MVNYDYLERGLWALARAHRINIMSGHLGAAVMAGYFIGEQHADLDPAVVQGIESELDRIIAGESVFSPKKNAALSAPAMFERFPLQQAGEDLIDGIAEALSKNINRPRASGHNVIFAATAIRGLADHPDLATPAITDGIRKLIAGFNDSSPGSGYYGPERGRIDGRKVTLRADDGVPPFSDLETAATVIIDEVMRQPAEKHEGFGGPWHLINHTAALAELDRYGYQSLAVAGLPALREHFRLYKTLPDISAEKGPETPTEDSPLTADFWTPEKIRRGRAHLTHRVKTLYGYEAICDLITNEHDRQQADDRLRYLM